jgi:hypothetical protein
MSASIQVGDVVYTEGVSAILGDVVHVNDEDGLARVVWRQTETTESVDDLIVERAATTGGQRWKIEIPFHRASDRAAVEMLRDELERWVTSRGLMYGAKPPVLVDGADAERRQS